MKLKEKWERWKLDREHDLLRITSWMKDHPNESIAIGIFAANAILFVGKEIQVREYRKVTKVARDEIEELRSCLEDGIPVEGQVVIGF